MAAQTKQESINLLPQKQFSSSTTGRVLSWVLSTFRVIVIVTELIVMVAFLSRFWLDAKNSDLTEDLEQKRAILASTAEFEQEFRETQVKLNLINTLDSNNDILANVLEAVTRGLPDGVILDSISLNSQSVEVSGLASSEQDIQQLIVNLHANKDIGSTSLRSIKPDTKDASLMHFEITVTSVATEKEQ